MGKFKVGQHVRLKKTVSWQPILPGTKLTIIGVGFDGVVYHCKRGAGRSYWINVDDLEPVEDGNDEASDSVSKPSGRRPWWVSSG